MINKNVTPNPELKLIEIWQSAPIINKYFVVISLIRKKKTEKGGQEMTRKDFEDMIDHRRKDFITKWNGIY